MNLRDIRRNYRLQELRRSDLATHPFEQFSQWLQEACDAEVIEPNAMVLATAESGAQPSQRTVLLKDLDERGFTFFTNYKSRKASQISENAQVSLLFPWYQLERQVGVTGHAEKISSEESAAYFSTRPRESQLGAWASQQSSIISSREVLKEKFEELDEQYRETPIPMPPFWGGFRVIPDTIEFWQGGSGRLHNRFRYSQRVDQSWEIDRLSP